MHILIILVMLIIYLTFLLDFFWVDSINNLPIIDDVQNKSPNLPAKIDFISGVSTFKETSMFILDFLNAVFYCLIHFFIYILTTFIGRAQLINTMINELTDLMVNSRINYSPRLYWHPFLQNYYQFNINVSINRITFWHSDLEVSRTLNFLRENRQSYLIKEALLMTLSGFIGYFLINYLNNLILITI